MATRNTNKSNFNNNEFQENQQTSEEQRKKNYDQMTDILNDTILRYKRKISTLLPVLAPEQQDNVFKWLDKMERYETVEQMCNYEMYLLYLVNNLEKGKLQRPFNKIPPSGPLPHIRCYIDEGTYNKLEKLRRSSRRNQIKTEEPEKGEVTCSTLEGVPPSKFFCVQPKPPDGIYCYAVVFSDFKNE